MTFVQMRAVGDDEGVVPEGLVGRLYQAGVDGALGVVSEFSPHQRANLAAYCYHKTHLHRIGLAVAATCEQGTLVQALGTVLGSVLYDQSRGPVVEVVRAPGVQRALVTLPTLR